MLKDTDNEDKARVRHQGGSVGYGSAFGLGHVPRVLG